MITIVSSNYDGLLDHIKQAITGARIPSPSIMDHKMQSKSKSSPLYEHLCEADLISLAEAFGGTRLYVPVNASDDHEMVCVRTNRHSAEPDHGGGEECKAGEMDGGTFVAGSKAAEVFEAVEASLDAIALFVGDGVVRDGDLARAV